MTRTVAAAAAALLALGARAQSPEPTPAPAAPTPAAPAPATAPEKPEKKKAEKGIAVLGEKSRITLAGRAWASFENVRASAGSAPGASKVPDRWRLRSNSSFFRVRGETELAAGWKAIAQVEAEFGLDGEEGLPFGGTRNSGVGLGSPFGTVILGRWDSPTKQTTIGLDPFVGTGIFGYYNVFGQQQVSPTGSGSNRWDRRLNNSVNYRSPSLHGFTVLAAYSVGETPRNGTVAVDPYTASAALHYRSGPLYVGASYETRNDCGNPDADAPSGPSCQQAALGSATQPKGTDQAFRAGIGFTIHPTFTKLAAAYEHIDLEADATATLARKTLRRDVYWGAVTQGLGTDTHQLIFAYGMATKASGSGVFADTADTGAWAMTAAYRFWLNRDTDLYAAYTQVKNRKNAAYRFGSGNFGAVPVGSTSTGFGAGMRYYF